LIFSKKPDRSVGARHAGDAHLPLPGAKGGQRRPASGMVSVIGPDLTITGNLETSGEVRIEGDVQGDVRAGRLVVGEQGRIIGDLVADEVVIGGSVQGSIRGNSVTFQSASHIEGEVYHRRLAIEQGAYFEGKSRRSDDPMAAQHPANGALPPR